MERSVARRRRPAPDPGTWLGVSNCPRKCKKNLQPFSGKSFYLDLPTGKNLQFLTEAIQQLGGVIEGFLSKEVSYIVSSRREAKAVSGGKSHSSRPGEVRMEAFSMDNAKGSHIRTSKKPINLVPMSRGKELLQKAIRNKERTSGGSSGSGSSLLTNARSWGVRVLHVDEMMKHVEQLSPSSLQMKKQESKKSEGTHPGTESSTRKVAKLKAPFLKIEDVSRCCYYLPPEKFRPFHHQFKSFPEISFLGPKGESPFETKMTPGSSHHTRKLEDPEPSLRSAVYTVPRRKKGYCECCQEAFVELHVHLQSAQHQGFAQEAHSYAEVDRIITQLSHRFADISQASLPGRAPELPSGSLTSDGDTLCPESPLTPVMKKEGGGQASGPPEQKKTVGNTKAPDEPGETGEVLGPEANFWELGESVDVSVGPPGIPVPKSCTYQCLLTSSSCMDHSSGPALAPAGHKRKAQFPSGSAEKKPEISWPRASFFVPRTSSPCGTKTAHSLPLTLAGHEPEPLASLLSLGHLKTCLSLPNSPLCSCASPLL